MSEWTMKETWEVGFIISAFVACFVIIVCLLVLYTKTTLTVLAILAAIGIVPLAVGRCAIAIDDWIISRKEDKDEKVE